MLKHSVHSSRTPRVCTNEWCLNPPTRLTDPFSWVTSSQGTFHQEPVLRATGLAFRLAKRDSQWVQLGSCVLLYKWTDVNRITSLRSLTSMMPWPKSSLPALFIGKQRWRYERQSILESPSLLAGTACTKVLPSVDENKLCFSALFSFDCRCPQIFQPFVSRALGKLRLYKRLTSS